MLNFHLYLWNWNLETIVYLHIYNIYRHVLIVFSFFPLMYFTRMIPYNIMQIFLIYYSLLLMSKDILNILHIYDRYKDIHSSWFQFLDQKGKFLKESLNFLDHGFDARADMQKRNLFARHSNLHLLLNYIVHHNGRIYFHIRFVVFSCYV